VYEYRVMGAGSIEGVERELNKRASEGWEPIEGWQETKWFGRFGPFLRRHVIVLRRPKPEAG
jgi:hypothetical protein